MVWGWWVEGEAGRAGGGGDVIWGWVVDGGGDVVWGGGVTEGGGA